MTADTWPAWSPNRDATDTEQEARDAMVRGVLGRRVLAFAVDGVLCTLILAVLWLVLLAFGLATFGLGLPLLGILPAVPFLYNWLSVCSGMSATPGQRLLGLLVRRNDNLARPTPLEGLIWTAGFVVTLSLGAIWFAVALVTVQHRTLHDLVSGLVVVRRNSLTARPMLWDASQQGRTSTEYV